MVREDMVASRFHYLWLFFGFATNISSKQFLMLVCTVLSESLPLNNCLLLPKIVRIPVELSNQVSSVVRRSLRINDKNLDAGIHSVIVRESGVEPRQCPRRRSFIVTWPGFSSTVESFHPLDFSRNTDNSPLNL